MRTHIWKTLTGDPAEFSMENRAFNYVGIISFIMLIICLFIDQFVGQAKMTVIITGLIAVQAVIFYFSRYHKQFQAGMFVYAFCSYGAMIMNYFYNSGIDGPTIFIFLLTFHLFIAIARPHHYAIWAACHIIIFTGLLYTQYIHPEWVPNTYYVDTTPPIHNSTADNAALKMRYLDIGITYAVALIGMFSITNYLRQYFNYQKRLLDKRAQAILEQNELITRQNEQLEKVNEQKNKLFSIISHDLRAPLDSVAGFLQLIAEEALSEEEKEEILTELSSQTKYTSELLMNILYWSKTQLQGARANLGPFLIKGQVEDTASFKIGTAAKKGIKLTYAVDPALEVIGDKDMLRIVLRNLINNAIKFTHPGGEIIIKVYKKDAFAEIAVRDNGIGIPPEKHQEIFTLKTHSTYGTQNEKGIGLGLSLCKEFINYQNGDIRFESDFGAGSVFFITLPLSKLQ